MSLPPRKAWTFRKLPVSAFSNVAMERSRHVSGGFRALPVAAASQHAEYSARRRPHRPIPAAGIQEKP